MKHFTQIDQPIELILKTKHTLEKYPEKIDPFRNIK